MAKQQRRWLVLGTGALLGGTGVVLGWLWFSLLSPWGYTLPAHLPAFDLQGPQRVFVFGTLRQPLVRRVVIGRPTATRPAILPGWRKQGLTLIPQPQARTLGEVFQVSPEELRRLDRYERLGIRYQRTRMRLAEGTMAWVYRRLDTHSTNGLQEIHEQN